MILADGLILQRTGTSTFRASLVYQPVLKEAQITTIIFLYKDLRLN